MTGTYLFCALSALRIVLASGLAFVVRDNFPVSFWAHADHPKRHVGSFFNVTVDERETMLTPLDSAKLGLDAAFHSDADNIGIYGSTAAGQTVPHMYPHLIPRYARDREDPRGGVRWILPPKAK